MAVAPSRCPCTRPGSYAGEPEVEHGQRRGRARGRDERRRAGAAGSDPRPRRGGARPRTPGRRPARRVATGSCTKKRSTSWTTPSARLTAASTRAPSATSTSVLPPPMSRSANVPATAPRPHEAPRRVRPASSSPLTTRGRIPDSARSRARNSRPSRAWRTAAVATSRTSAAPRASARSRKRRTAASVRSAAAGASVPRSVRPSPRRVTVWSAHSGTERDRRIRLRDEDADGVRPEVDRGERSSHRRRAEARSISVATVARSVSRPTGFSTTASMPCASRVSAATRPGQPVIRTTGAPGRRSLRRPGDLETGAAGQHEVRHHEVHRLAAEQRDRLADVARGSHHVALAHQPLDQALPHRLVVVDHENPARGAGAGLGPARTDPGSRGGRQAKADRRSLPRHALDLELASMPGGHRPDHRQPDAEPPRAPSS